MSVLAKIRQHGFVVAAGSVLIALVLIRYSAISTAPGASRDDDEETSSSIDLDSVSVVQRSSEKSMTGGNGAAPGPPARAAESLSQVESSLVANDEIDMAWFEENNVREDVFDLLVDELRNATDLDASGNREKYEELFLFPEQTQTGAVSLNTLECGSSLCAVEFSGNDDTLLNAYAKSVFTHTSFEVYAIFQPYWDDSERPDVYRRYIFSHRPEIDTISSSEGKAVWVGKGRVNWTPSN